jgi:hypothetical protein
MRNSDHRPRLLRGAINPPSIAADSATSLEMVYEMATSRPVSI